MPPQGNAPVGAMASGPPTEGGQSKVLAGLAHRVFTINFEGTLSRLTFLLVLFFCFAGSVFPRFHFFFRLI